MLEEVEIWKERQCRRDFVDVDLIEEMVLEFVVFFEESEKVSLGAFHQTCVRKESFVYLEDLENPASSLQSASEEKCLES